MTDDEEMRRLEQALSQLRAIGEAELHVALEQQADASPDYSWPPAPNTAHPWHEKHADTVRHYMTEGQWDVMVAPPRKPLHRLLSQPMDAAPRFDDRPQPIRMEVRRAAGLAPYVGREFVYEWKVAVDPYNRWVAGDATPRYRPLGACDASGTT